MNIFRYKCTLRPFLVVAAFLPLTTMSVRANNLQICKDSDPAAPVTGTFTFTVVGLKSVSVAVGGCMTIMDTGQGNFTVTEDAVSGTAVTSIVVAPAAFRVSFDLAARSATVEVRDTTTTVRFTNSATVAGRFTGGGSIFTSTGDRVTHGFELHCSTSDTPNTLEVNVGANNFHLGTLTSATCTLNPVTGVATITGAGTGTYNNVPGATISFTFTDAGEPGTSDFASYLIKDSGGTTVLSTSGLLDKGNQQFHPAH
jgi:hypothetical protein